MVPECEFPEEKPINISDNRRIQTFPEMVGGKWGLQDQVCKLSPQRSRQL